MIKGLFCSKSGEFYLKKFLFFFIFCLPACEGFFKTKWPVERGSTWAKAYPVRLVSQSTLPGVLSKEHYLIKAYFPEDSRLELFSHFQGFDLEDGVKIYFLREKRGLTIKISVQGFPEKILFEREDYFSSSLEGDWTLEIDNGTNYGFRVRVWENWTNKSGFLKTKSKILTNENLLADSLSKGLTFYDRGWGLKWGFKLFRVRLIEGARVSPKVL